MIQDKRAIDGVVCASADRATRMGDGDLGAPDVLCVPILRPVRSHGDAQYVVRKLTQQSMMKSVSTMTSSSRNPAFGHKLKARSTGQVKALYSTKKI